MLCLEWVIITQGEEGCRSENGDGSGDIDGSLGVRFVHEGEGGQMLKL